MSLLVVDASVAVKWLLPEDGSDAARALSSRELHAPALLLVECANVFWRKVRRGELTASKAVRLSRLLDALPVILHPITPSLTALACEIALRLNHPIYDCLYLAVASDLGASQLVTADHRFVNVASAPPSQWREIVRPLKDFAD